MSKISIIIPTYNRCSLLKRALNSVYQQSYVNHEVIVIDDGSTDKTTAMIADCFPQVNCYSQSNKGVSAARNMGINKSSGEWIAFLDSDDEWLPEKLEKQISLLNANPEYKICHTEELWIRDGVRVNQMKKHKKQGGWIFPQCLPLCAMSPSSIMIHHSLFNELGDFDSNLPACEDYDLWLRITAKYPVLYIEEPQIKKYGGHEDQLSKKHWGMDRYRITALQKILAGGTLSNENEAKAIVMLLKKCKVFKNGALKREKAESADYYQSIIDQFSKI